MRLPPKVLLFLLAVTALFALALLVINPTEPTHAGKPLSYWIRQFRNDTLVDAGETIPHSPSPEYVQKRRQAIDAVRQIGTNGLPFLLKWIRYEPPLLGSRFIPRSPRWLISKLDYNQNRLNRANYAVQAIAALGTNASAAIPALEALASDKTHRFMATHAAVSLSYLGPEALPAMVRALPAHPILLSTIIAHRMIPTLNTRDRLPLLLKIMQTEPDPLRSAASNAVRRIAPEFLSNSVER